jgi:3-oxoadipate enol-lactonase
MGLDGQQNGSNGVRIAYDDVGDGPAILFIHGFMFDRTMWHDVVAALDGWRRIAPDLRGMGESEASDGRYDMVAYANDLAALLDVLGIERAALCGLSLGGYVCCEFLRRYRERVAALIVMSARAEADTPERRTSRDDMIARVRRRGVRALAQELAPKFLAETSTPDTKQRLKEMMERTSVVGTLGALEAMRDRPTGCGARGLRSYRVLATLPRLKTPPKLALNCVVFSLSSAIESDSQPFNSAHPAAARGDVQHDLPEL